MSSGYNDGNMENNNYESNTYDRNLSSNSFDGTLEGTTSTKEELHIPTLFNQTVYFILFFCMKLGYIYQHMNLIYPRDNSRLTIALFMTMSSFGDNSMSLIDVHGRYVFYFLE